MPILGLDYGRKKIGVALATSMLAEAYDVIRYESVNEAIEKIERVAKKEKVKKVVVGVSEGKMAKESRNFGLHLEKELGIKVIFQDETMTTKDAERLSIEAGIQRKKRKKFEDAYAAALILQNFLEKP
ncbi:Holliday junction resolvase RuvX [Patescibacteria group bacterium]